MEIRGGPYPELEMGPMLKEIKDQLQYAILLNQEINSSPKNFLKINEIISHISGRKYNMVDPNTTVLEAQQFISESLQKGMRMIPDEEIEEMESEEMESEKIEPEEIESQEILKDIKTKIDANLHFLFSRDYLNDQNITILAIELAKREKLKMIMVIILFS